MNNFAILKSKKSSGRFLYLKIIYGNTAKKIKKYSERYSIIFGPVSYSKNLNLWEIIQDAYVSKLLAFSDPNQYVFDSIFGKAFTGSGLSIMAQSNYGIVFFSTKGAAITDKEFIELIKSTYLKAVE